MAQPASLPPVETPDSIALRNRLHAFYTIHAPTEVDGKVRHAMGLGLQEAELFQLLEKKYSTTAAAATAPTVAAPTAALPPAMNQVVPPPHVQATTPATPVTTSAPQLPAAGTSTPAAIDFARAPGSFEDRLRAFYALYNPTEADKKIPVALKMNVPEATLWENLYKNYQLDGQGRPLNGGAVNSSAADAPPPPSLPPQAAANPISNNTVHSAESLEGKLRRFYSVYASDAVDQKTAAALGTGLAEAELFTLLGQKYGLTLDTALAVANHGSPSSSTSALAAQPQGPHAHLAASASLPVASVSVDDAFGSSPPRDIDLEGLKQRLTAFFTRFDRTADVDRRVRDSLDVVASGHMTEDELVKFVEQQYGPALELRIADSSVLPPTASEKPATPGGRDAFGASQVSAPSATSSRGDRTALRGRLERFYRAQGVLEFADKVDYALRLDADDDIIMEKVMSKYGATTEPSSPGLVKSSLLEFHQDRAPQQAPQHASESPGQSMSDLHPSLERKRSVTFSELGADAQEDAKRKRREHLKARLTAFYMRFNPSNIDKVDLALTLDIPEDVLFTKLYEKYNLDQHGEPLEVGGALNRFESGRESPPNRLPPLALPPPSPTRRQSVMSSRKALEDRLFVVYAKNYSSAEAAERAQRVTLLAGESIDDAVARITQEQSLVSPQPDPERSAIGSRAPSRISAEPTYVDSGAPLRDRLVAFYEVHRPSEVTRVDDVLSAGITEDQIWNRLSERYGSEAVTPFRHGGTASPPSDFPEAVLNKVVSMRSTTTARRSPPPILVAPLTGAELNRLVDRVADESEDPLAALDRATHTSQQRQPSQPMRYTVGVAHPSATISPAAQPTSTSRAVQFLLRLPEVSMYLIHIATEQQRSDFTISLERDVRGFAQVNGAIGVACETEVSPQDDSIAMQYVALFPNPIGAARFRALIGPTNGGAAPPVPLPATRAAYLLLGGNVHSVREGRISGAVFTDNVPPALLISPPEVAVAATPTRQPHEGTVMGVQSDVSQWQPGSRYEPGVVPSEQYQTPPAEDARPTMRLANAASPMLASLRLRRLQGSTNDTDVLHSEERRHTASVAMDYDEPVVLTADDHSSARTWGQLLAHQHEPTGGDGSSVATREHQLRQKERSLQAMSLELKDRQRALQEREAALREVEARIRSSQDEEREANRQRRDKAAEASMRFESLSIRENEVKERERQLARRAEALDDRERTTAAHVTELEQRVAFVDERERRVTLRERQLNELTSPSLVQPRTSTSNGNGQEAAYIEDLEKKLREARQRIAALEGSPSSAMVLQAQRHANSDAATDMRLRHVVEREALVAESEARMQRRSQAASAEVRQEDEQARRRWEELRRHDRDLLARRLEVEAMHNSVQRQQTLSAVAASSSSVGGSSSPKQVSPQQLGAASISSHSAAHTATSRSLFTAPHSDATTPPVSSSFSYHAARDGSSTLLRQDDIATMLSRVKERERMIRSMSERMTPSRVVQGH